MTEHTAWVFGNTTCESFDEPAAQGAGRATGHLDACAESMMEIVACSFAQPWEGFKQHLTLCFYANSERDNGQWKVKSIIRLN